MGKLWMQARANIRKTKSVTATLVVLFLMAALLLNTGLLVAINYGGFFDELKQELAPADAYFAIPDAIYTDEVKQYIEENAHVERTQTHEARLADRSRARGKKNPLPSCSRTWTKNARCPSGNTLANICRRTICPSICRISLKP